MEGIRRNRAYKFRLRPTNEQRNLFARTFGCCRFLYNHMLGEKIKEYKLTGKQKRTTPAMYKQEYVWLKEVDSLALCNVQLHLESAYKAFFLNPKIGFPKFKSKHFSRQSYTTNVVNGNIRITGNKIRLPKIGEVRMVKHREIPEGYQLKSATISKESNDRYFISLLFETEESENQASFVTSAECKVLGVDYAMDGLGVFSDGSRAGYPKYYRVSQEHLGREQRKLSRCQKGSSNYQKQRRKVAKVYEKIRNQRKDYLHKLSYQIAEKYDAVAVEDLDMKAMSQCLKLGKGVMDNGNGMFRTFLKYKLEERGKKLIRVGRFYPSSKKCSCCGRIKENLELSERIYRCVCGNVMDRDLNAAINIREEGIRILGA